MREYFLTVFVSDESAVTLDQAMLKAGLERVQGPCAVFTKRVTGVKSRGKIVDGWELRGTAIAVDLEGDDLDVVNDRLARDIGTIGAVAKGDGAYKAGEPVTLEYVCNHDGLPLAYNGAIRDTFRVLKGRVGINEVKASITDAYDYFIGAGRIGELKGKTADEVIAMFKAASA